MERRTLIAGAGICSIPFIAGIGLSGHNKPEAFPHVSVESDEFRAEENLTLSVSVDRQFTRENPARLEITLENERDEAFERYFGSSPPFSSYTPENSSGIFLVPASNDHLATSSNGSSIVPEGQVDGCWQIPSAVATYGGEVERTIPAGGSVREVYTVLTAPGTSSCLPRGEYRFEAREYASTGTSWGFDLILE